MSRFNVIETNLQSAFATDEETTEQGINENGDNASSPTNLDPDSSAYDPMN